MIESSERIIKHKVGLLNLAEELGNVSQACKVMGLSRDTFYRYKSAVEDGGVDALLDKSRRKPNLKNRVDLSIEQAVISRCHRTACSWASPHQQRIAQARRLRFQQRRALYLVAAPSGELQAPPEGPGGSCGRNRRDPDRRTGVRSRAQET